MRKLEELHKGEIEKKTCEGNMGGLILLKSLKRCNFGDSVCQRVVTRVKLQAKTILEFRICNAGIQIIDNSIKAICYIYVF